jgi:hypothetical protein
VCPHVTVFTLGRKSLGRVLVSQQFSSSKDFQRFRMTGWMTKTEIAENVGFCTMPTVKLRAGNRAIRRTLVPSATSCSSVVCRLGFLRTSKKGD